MIHLSLLYVCVNSKGQHRDELLPNSGTQKVITSCNTIAIDLPHHRTTRQSRDVRSSPVIDRSRANTRANRVLSLIGVRVTGYRGSFRNTNGP